MKKLLADQTVVINDVVLVLQTGQLNICGQTFSAKFFFSWEVHNWQKEQVQKGEA